ncbi:unnamed protein product, partial [Symbiodinium microadriaticum]
ELVQLQAKIKELENQLAGKAAPPRPSQVPCQTPQNRVRSKAPPSPAPSSVQDAAKSTAEDDDNDEVDEGEGGDAAGKVTVTSPDGTIVLTQDALRMRLKRLCEKKSKSQKCHVDDETHQQYLSGGPEREWLEMALLEALQSVGPEALGRGKAAHRQASFKVQVTMIRERRHLKESESNGEWLTEERMQKSGEYSKQTIKSIVSYCERFPQVLTRKWKYNNDVLEYFVETSTKQTIKHSELLKRVETTQEREAGDMPTDVQQVGMVSEGEAKPKNEQVEDKARCRDKVARARNTIKKPCADLIAMESRVLVLLELKKGLKRGADIKQTDNIKETVVARAFAKAGLRLDVKLSYAHVGQYREHPYIPVSSWIQSLDQAGRLGKLVGCSMDDLPKVLSSYWANFKQVHPKHQVFDLQTPLDRCLPVYLHGDEGTTYKKDGALVLSFQSPLGRGTSKNKVGNVLGGNKQFMNFIGHAFETRFLIVAGLKEDYRTCPDVYKQYLELATSSLDDACRNGVPLRSGQVLHPIPLGHKGDWSYMVFKASFSQYNWC